MTPGRSIRQVFGDLEISGDLRYHRRGTNPRASINRTPCGNRRELLDAVAADADVPVVEVDGGIAMAGDEADLVADLEAVGGALDAEAAVLVGSALVGRGGLVADQGGPESKASAFRPASTIARSSVGRLITVAHTKRLGSNALIGAPSRSRRSRPLKTRSEPSSDIRAARIRIYSNRSCRQRGRASRASRATTPPAAP